MDLDKRSHDFLLYTALRNYWDTDRLTKADLRWMITYLEDRLEFYVSRINLDDCEFSGKSVVQENKK